MQEKEKKFKFFDCVALNEYGEFDDSAKGKFGYQVFYDVSVDLVKKYHKNVPDNCIGGILEFSVDANGKPFGEILLWSVLPYNPDYPEYDMLTHDFVSYPEDISEFVEDFNNQEDKNTLEFR